MILINRCWATVTPESARDGDIADSGLDAENVGYSFRELVDLMKEHTICSCSPATGSTYEWLSDGWNVEDYTTATEIEHTIHFSRNNPPRKVKYWKKAMQAAGLI